jgi:hypothetical protein
MSNTPKVVSRIDLSTHEITYADISHLNSIGIKKVFNNGINDLGLTDRTIICNDYTVWDYCEEDRLYEKRRENYIPPLDKGSFEWYRDHQGNLYEDYEQSIGE